MRKTIVIYIICMQHSIDRISLLVTYSRYLVHGAGSDMAMKIQLVSMVNIMKRLKNLEEKNVLRKLSFDVLQETRLNTTTKAQLPCFA